MYYYECELVFKSYMPKQLEIGMLFINVTENEKTLFELDSIPRDEEKFIIDNGAPMELHIVDGDDVLATYNEIGWMDDGDDVDELRELSIDDLNYIINEYNGWIELEIIEEFFDEEDQIIPNFVQEKVVIRLLTEEEEL